MWGKCGSDSGFNVSLTHAKVYIQTNIKYDVLYVSFYWNNWVTSISSCAMSTQTRFREKTVWLLLTLCLWRHPHILAYTDTSN